MLVHIAVSAQTHAINMHALHHNIVTMHGRQINMPVDEQSSTSIDINLENLYS